jgi:hypothetical protein
MDKAIDPALRAGDAAGLDVLPQKVSRVASFSTLLRGEIAGLTGSDAEESIPIRRLFAGLDHAQNVTYGSVLCKAAR